MKKNNAKKTQSTIIQYNTKDLFTDANTIFSFRKGVVFKHISCGARSALDVLHSPKPI